MIKLCFAVVNKKSSWLGINQFDMRNSWILLHHWAKQVDCISLCYDIWVSEWIGCLKWQSTTFQLYMWWHIICRRIREAGGPTVGLPFHRHFIGFFYAMYLCSTLWTCWPCVLWVQHWLIILWQPNVSFQNSYSSCTEVKAWTYTGEIQSPVLRRMNTGLWLSGVSLLLWCSPIYLKAVPKILLISG